MKTLLVLAFLLLVFQYDAQISLTTIGNSYTQDFNSLPTTTDGSALTWSDNASLTGFYVSPGSINFESSPSSMNNTGKPYIFQVGADRSIGSRASGSSPNNNIYIGARFKNNTGVVINSLEISYYGEQWTIAENGSNVNVIQFHYQKSASSLTSLTSGSWTNVSALNFTQIYTSSQSSGMGGSACSGTSNQCLSLNGNTASNRVLNYAVFNVTINPGDEIMLRWYDKDDPSNDHHLQIDDFELTPWNVPANVVLPITLSDFTVECQGDKLDFSWTTFSERNSDYFTLESSKDGSSYQKISDIPGAGNSNSTLYYHWSTNSSEAIYFRLKQTDFDGKYSYSDPVFMDCSSEISIFPNPNKGNFEIKNLENISSLSLVNELGQLIFQENISGKESVQLHSLASGVYFLKSMSSQNEAKIQKIIVD